MPTDTDTFQVVSPSASPQGGNFPGASYAVYTAGTYQFIHNTGAQSLLLGRDDGMSLPLLIYADPVLLVNRPFTYNDSFTDSFYHISALMQGAGTVQMTADGWGTLQLPGGNYNDVLRIRTVFQQHDTLYGGPALVISDLTSVRYTWFDTAHKTPLLTWDSITVTTNVSAPLTVKVVNYLETGLTTGIEPAASGNLALRPYLNRNRLYINGNLETGLSYDIQLLDMNGKVLVRGKERASGPGLMLPLAHSLSQGMYLLQVRDSQGRMGTAKLIQAD